ncbi:unnamed protein product [Brachionus calyciflorus]|uniref:Uncharacterized protein n=1 Tax=Brachionus calyciflorus TaxID=104777 RepID=A0A814FIP9_9BILA|nr:unnamed protein product [Brachionus calyciflorus]
MYNSKFLTKFQIRNRKTYSTLVSNSIEVLKENDDHVSKNLSPFLSSTSRGFLPRIHPVLNIPNKYSILDEILNKMRWNQPDGSLGLIAKKQLSETIRHLPQYEVNDIDDKMVALALNRDYSFLTSAYLFEDCHHNYLNTKKIWFS